MTPLSRLTAYILLPLLLSPSYWLFHRLGAGALDEDPLQAASTLLTLLLAALPPLTFRFIICSQLKEGFALLRDGRVVLPSELRIADVLGHRITAWKLFRQHMETEVCLQGEGELLYVRLGFDFTLHPNELGKGFIQHLQHNMTIFEAWVQRVIYLASTRDSEMAHHVGPETLLNEEDERILRRKFLYALRSEPLQSVLLPASSSEIRLKREVRRREKIASVEEELKLDSALLQQLGLPIPD